LTWRASFRFGDGEVAGDITLVNVRKYAESGADLIRVAALTQSVRAMSISFQLQMG